MSPESKVRLNGYVLVPLLVVGAGIGMYFSGFPLLQGVAAPAANREFGFLENVQNLTLLAVVVLAFRSARREPPGRLRIASWIMTVGAFVILLEELDYGQHWIRLAGGDPTPGDPVNIHNQGDINKWLKRGSDIGMLLVFGILPFLVRNKPIAAWAPSPWGLATLAVGAALSELAHTLDDKVATNGSLTGNISEFRETITYWVVALYVFELVVRRAKYLEEEAASADPPGGAG